MKFTAYLGDDEIEAVVEYSFSPELPAKTYGPMDDCYPAEAAEIEIESVTFNGRDIYSSLSAETKEQIETEALEHAVNAAIDFDEQKADHDRSREQF